MMKLLSTHDKIPDKKQFNAGRVYWDPRFKRYMVEKAWWQAFDVAGHVVFAVKKQMDTGAPLTFPFYSV